MTLAGIVKLYSTVRPGLSACHVANLGYTLNRFRVYLGREPQLSDLTRLSILGFMAWARTAGRSPKTCNDYRCNLLILWNFAAEEELLPAPGRIGKLKEPRRLPVVWSLDQLAALFDSCDLLEGAYPNGVAKSLTWRIALSILWDTGCRIGTLYAAKLADVNFSSGVWLAPAETIKGGRGDKLYRLHPATLRLIRSAGMDRPKLWPYPFHRRNAAKHFGELLALAGLPGDRLHKFHCIRRSAETHAAASMGISWAAAAVGHSEQVARRHYVNPHYLKAPALFEALPRLSNN
jgi:integrase